MLDDGSVYGNLTVSSVSNPVDCFQISRFHENKQNQKQNSTAWRLHPEMDATTGVCSAVLLREDNVCMIDCKICSFIDWVENVFFPSP